MYDCRESEDQCCKEMPFFTDEDRIDTLKGLIEIYLPNLVEAVTKAVTNKASTLVLTPDLYEDEFTPQHHFHSYNLLGMAVKYVGLHGLQCQIADIKKEVTNGQTNLR